MVTSRVTLTNDVGSMEIADECGGLCHPRRDKFTWLSSWVRIAQGSALNAARHGARQGARQAGGGELGEGDHMKQPALKAGEGGEGEGGSYI